MTGRNWFLGLSLIVFLVGCGSEEGNPPETAGKENPAAATTAPATAGDNFVEDLAEKFPVVVIQTSAGAIKLQLDGEKAPQTVRNFLKYVEQGHYDDTTFHQVVDGYLIQGGIFTEEGQPKSESKPIRNEADNGLKNRRGTIAMARDPADSDSATCEFFINVGDNAYLDHRGNAPLEYGFCVFGEVVSGMEVVDRISKMEVADEETYAPVQTVKIESVRTLR